jgi:hypothetical protein
VTIRVLHCPTDTGRNAWTLAQAEKSLGLDSRVLVFQRSWLEYPDDYHLRLRERSGAGRAAAVAGAFLRAARDFDVIHFNGGRSLMPSSPGWHSWLSRLDLALLRALGKGIVVTYQGCDVRQRSFCEGAFSVNGCSQCTNQCTPELDRHKQRLVAGFERYADVIYALNPDLLRVLPPRAEFLPYTTVDLDEWRPLPATADSRRFTVVHAPTNRGLKGTDAIVAAVGELQARHGEVELLLVEHLPHAEVKACYARGDLLVDQVLIGWYGGLSVEAMALGRPVMCYLREPDLRLIPDGMRAELPVIRVTADTLLPALEDALARRDELVAVGARSRAYVEHWHDPLVVAARTKATYERILNRRHRR